MSKLDPVRKCSAFATVLACILCGACSKNKEPTVAAPPSDKPIRNDADAKKQAVNNLKQIMLGLQTYGEDFGILPISGVADDGPLKNTKKMPLLSWRVAILPFIEEERSRLDFRYDEPWDSEHNKKLIDKMPKMFAPPPGVNAPPGHTCVQMVVGPKASQPGMTLLRMTDATWDLVAKSYPGVTLLGITDGTSNTIALVEAAQPVIWTKPDDVFIPGNEMPQDLKKKFGGHFTNGMWVAMWDGSVGWVDLAKIDEKDLWSAITPNGGEVIWGEWIEFPAPAKRSRPSTPQSAPHRQ